MISDYGRHDKIELVLHGAVTYDDLDDLNTVINSSHNKLRERPKVFTAPRRSGRSLWQEIARNTWLFAGKLRYHGQIDQGARSVRLELSINPTRFAAYAQRFDPSSVADLREIELSDLLHRDPQRRASLEAASLAQWDNWIPSTPWISSVTKEWQQLLALYIEAVSRFVTEDFNTRAAITCPNNPPKLRLQDLNTHVPSLQHAEVHWELSASDARLSYAALERALRATAHNFSVQEQINLSEGRDDAARWISIKMRKGVRFTVYAKLDGRIRLEVTYKGPPSIGDIVQSDLRFRSNTPLVERLERLRIDGARCINRLLGELPSIAMVKAADDMVELSRALEVIARTAQGNVTLIRETLSQLTFDGSITARRNTSLCRLAEDLTKLGVMQRVAPIERNLSRRFVLISSLATTFARFRDRCTNHPEGVVSVSEG
ncbi:hypothetical protein [Microvirga makkahensis]|uniref:Uncharacterized protein n=1 Tax=Microvirga makkahensis TaxID=1128670 RepID=A0A7X3MQ64_9HYPH|nr:hypothetical protein [Microvirga makkahensis]MXQ11191.1 hypothetical protein [Microvirga makkahensis]